jgi:hypothetical protein
MILTCFAAILQLFAPNILLPPVRFAGEYSIPLPSLLSLRDLVEIDVQQPFDGAPAVPMHRPHNLECAPDHFILAGRVRVLEAMFEASIVELLEKLEQVGFACPCARVDPEYVIDSRLLRCSHMPTINFVKFLID